MSDLTKDLLAADLPEILAQFLNGDMPLPLAKRFRAYFEEVADEDDASTH